MTKCGVKKCTNNADVKDGGVNYCAKCWIKIRYKWFKNNLNKTDKLRRNYG